MSLRVQAKYIHYIYIIVKFGRYSSKKQACKAYLQQNILAFQFFFIFLYCKTDMNP